MSVNLCIVATLAANDATLNDEERARRGDNCQESIAVRHERHYNKGKRWVRRFALLAVRVSFHISR